VRRRGFRRALEGTLSGLDEFYLTSDDRRYLQTLPRFRKFARRVLWLIRGLLLKLTPARRIMLFVALVSLLFGYFRIEVNTVYISIRLQALANVLLLFLIGLELKDKLVARDELEAGRAVQLALMPPERPRVPGWDVWLYTRPANDVGGDLVDHLALDAGHHAVLLGDVAGKALPAALLSVKLQATIRALAPNYDNLGELGAAVNRILHRDGLPTRFASLIYAVLASDSGVVKLLNAGHMPPLRLRGAALTTLANGSMVLGMMPDVPFVEQSTSVEPGDSLIVYSDGVSEAMNEAGDFFGDERLHALALETHAMNAGDAGGHILAGLSRFVGEAVQNDDVSLMVLRRTS
jgi:sigma-B regulation protein RsbU (phosphoserine phosphatase)